MLAKGKNVVGRGRDILLLFIIGRRECRTVVENVSRKSHDLN